MEFATTVKPVRWEVRIAMQCFARFGCINPLVVSAKTRAELSDRKGPFYQLLRARWEGKDFIAKELVTTLLNVSEHSM